MQAAGFEPAHQAWKACILTRLDDACARRGNPGLVFKVRSGKRVTGGESEELPPIGMGFSRSQLIVIVELFVELDGAPVRSVDVLPAARVWFGRDCDHVRPHRHEGAGGYSRPGGRGGRNYSAGHRVRGRGRSESARPYCAMPIRSRITRPTRAPIAPMMITPKSHRPIRMNSAVTPIRMNRMPSHTFSEIEGSGRNSAPMSRQKTTIAGPTA